MKVFHLKKLVSSKEAEEIPVTLSVGLLTTIFITGKYNKKKIIYNFFLSLVVYLLHVSNFLNCNKSKIFRRFKFFLRTTRWWNCADMTHKKFPDKVLSS